MIVLRDPADVARVKDAAIAALLTQHFVELSIDVPYDPDIHGFLVGVEAGDTPEQLEQETGCWITSGLFSDAKYGEPGFVPSFEFLEELPFCFEMVFVLNDGGFGVLFAIPKTGIDENLLRYCKEFSTPAPAQVIPNMG